MMLSGHIRLYDIIDVDGCIKDNIPGFVVISVSADGQASLGALISGGTVMLT